MIRNVYRRLIIILVIAALAIWIDLNDRITLYNPLNDTRIVDRAVKPRLGLDLQGGLQVLLEADLPESTPIDSNAMEIARTIMENRTNALGVSENLLQIAGDRRIVGEFPGWTTPMKFSTPSSRPVCWNSLIQAALPCRKVPSW